MKKLFGFLLLTLPFVSKAQTDSTRISQTITLKQKYVLHFLGSMDWGNTDVINLLNEYRPQHDNLNNEKVITVHIPSGLVAEGMQRLSYLPEGMATQYNEDMAAALFPQITNPWLLNRMLAIRQANFEARDSRNKATAQRVEQIKILQ